MEKHQVVPDLISKVPPLTIDIKFGDLAVNYGNELTPTQVKNQPTTLSWKANQNTLYTLVFIDPDAPSRTSDNRFNFLHWIVANVPGTNISQGDEIVQYCGSGPPQGTGLHRYVYLIYQQQNRIDVSREIEEGKEFWTYRKGFDLDKFIDNYKLGEAIAGNFYQAQFDDYVPILHKSFPSRN